MDFINSLDTILQAYDKGLVIAKRINDSKIRAALLNNKGGAYLKFGQREQAFTFFQKAVAVYDLYRSQLYDNTHTDGETIR